MRVAAAVLLTTLSRRSVAVAVAVGLTVAVGCYLAGHLIASTVSGGAGGLLALVWRAAMPLLPVLRLMRGGGVWGPRG